MAKKNKSKIVYQEFGESQANPALARAVPDLPPNQQDLRIQATRKGKKGKTVTVITGFQHQSQTLNQLLKKLKAQCGSGGTIKENTMEIQGDHRENLVKILQNLGYRVKVSGG